MNAPEVPPPSAVDMSPGAITARLREMSQLRDFCIQLGALGRANGLNRAASEESAMTERAQLVGAPQH